MIFYHSCYKKYVLIQNKNYEIHENRKQTFLTEQFNYEYIVMASFFFYKSIPIFNPFCKIFTLICDQNIIFKGYDRMHISEFKNVCFVSISTIRK